MPDPEVIRTRRPITRSRLASDMRRLGVAPGAVVMVHTALSRLGWVVGGSQTVVRSLLDCVGSNGTLCAQASWDDIPFRLSSWPRPWRDAYEAELPPFDPSSSAAAPYEGRLVECLRTWPGAKRSANPATGVAAVGRRARELTAGHRLDDGFGAGTPYARLVEWDGRVLLLGAPLHTISLLHHAEALARAPKRWTTYRVPLKRDGGATWVTIREIDVWDGPFPYAPECGDRPLATIATAALAAGIGRQGTVGEAAAYLFPARALTRFAVGWLENHFATDSLTRTRVRSGVPDSAVS